MSGWVAIYGDCLACGGLFMFNPTHVPSLPVNGVRQPICRTCMEHANQLRTEAGVPPHPIHPEAYEAAPEHELAD